MSVFTIYLNSYHDSVSLLKRPHLTFLKQRVLTNLIPSHPSPPPQLPMASPPLQVMSMVGLNRMLHGGNYEVQFDFEARANLIVVKLKSIRTAIPARIVAFVPRTITNANEQCVLVTEQIVSESGATYSEDLSAMYE